MKILIPDWNAFGKEDIRQALESLGHTVVYYTDQPRNYRRDPKFRSALRQWIRQEQIDLLFSSNFFPILSDTCHDLNIPYISWCYDSPLVLTYAESIFHPCNFLFLFDSQMVAELHRLGVSQAYYLPMAVNPQRLDTLRATPAQAALLDADISFVGALYNEKHNLYDRFADIPDFLKGYLEGIMAAQRQVYGTMFLEQCLPTDILTQLQQYIPLETSRDGHETLSYLYANYFLCRKITQRERMECIQLLDQKTDWKTKLYTPQETPQYSHVQNMGTVHYEQEMPLVFRHSRINLNITLRSIQAGIPLRAMDILGAGGFLLTNYQPDFDRHFTAGKEYVLYEDLQDMLAQIEYYLSHEKERQDIAAAGHRTVVAHHTYTQRFEEIFSILSTR